MNIRIESTSAETCHTNHLVVGSKLVSSTKHGDVSIEITHIGKSNIRAKTLSDNRRGPSNEVGMALQCWREWCVLV